MRKRSGGLILLLAGWLAPAPLYADQPVAVVLSADEEVHAEQRTLFVASLRAELGKYEGLTAVSAPSMAGQSATDDACPDQAVTCLTALAQALGAERVVAARLASLGDLRVISLKDLDLARAEVVASVTRQLTASEPEAYLLVLGEAVAELMGERPLRPGAHAGVAAESVRRWRPPPLPAWAFWSGVGVTAAAAAGGLTAALLARAAENDFNRLAQSSGVVDGQRLVALEERAEGRARLANIFWAATAACAVGTTVAFFFVDFDEGEELTVAGWPADGGGWLGLTLRL